VHCLEYVYLWVIATRKLDLGCDLAISLLKLGGVVHVHLEDLHMQCRRSCSIHILDSNLQLPRDSVSITLSVFVYRNAYSTPPRLTSATQL
jgi:hypothetical protein